MQKQIYPCLWFDGNAKEAAAFYCSVFENSAIRVDTPMVVIFDLAGRQFMGLNGGPQFKINPSISFFVNCATEAEADEKWNRLSEGGHVMIPIGKYEWSTRYGWLQDRYGVSWQIYTGKPEDTRQAIVPSLLFTGKEGKAERAVNYYASVFRNSSVKGILKAGPGEKDREGLVTHAQFTLDGNVFAAMDGGADHAFTFNEGVSLVIDCDTQDEIDYYWNKLTDGGKESMCGWLVDRFGVSWQVVPAAVLGRIMSDPDKASRTMPVIMKMKKLNIEELVKA